MERREHVFELRVERRDERALERLNAGERTRLAGAILALQRDPLADGHQRKKLSGRTTGWYRLRVGTWRIVYSIRRRVVTVLGIVPRKDLERWLRGVTR